jgi:predicted nucleotidyltransferase
VLVASPSVEDLLREFFAAAPPGIIAVYLFGSVARGQARPGSDVDVAVLFRQQPRPSLEGLPLDLEGQLERRLGATVDLVALNDAPADLVHRVLRDGKVVFDSDPAARIRFEVEARNQYFDLLPFLERYRQVLRGP